MLAPGTRLATYEVRERLAVGGMGEVYLCRHRLLDRIDAVKVLRPHLVADEAFRRRFLREALAVARLRHPHIVTVYTADEVDGQLFLAMEYIPGADLAALVARDSGLHPQRVVALLTQVADALDAAHRLQMMHRDVKPSNVLVERPAEPTEHAYLVDFGLSKTQQRMDQDITQAGQVMGSVAYIAPEQLEGKDTDGRCDQYSLACMAFECLTGRLPFPYENQIAVLTAHLATPPPAVSGVRPGLPAAVDAVIARGMAKARDDRFPTCGAFAGALRDALAPPPVRPAPPTGPLRQQRAPTPPLAPAPSPGQAPTAPPVPPPGAPRPPTRPVPTTPTHPTPTRQTPSHQTPSHPTPTRQVPAAPPRPPGAPEPARLCLAVVGGPEGGGITPLPDGDHIIAPPCTGPIGSTDPGAARFTLKISGWAVHVVDAREVRVTGEAVVGSRGLRPGDLVEAGPSLLEVRRADQLAALQPGAVLHDAVTLNRIAHERLHVARRGPQHPHAMVVRLGWRPGRPPGPMWLSVGGTTAVALRGEPEQVNSLVRWILAQALVLHDARDLCVAVAIALAGADRWAWVGSAPHARPGAPPLTGLHTTTTAEGAADLIARLRHVIELRRQVARGGPAHHASAVLPRILAVLDDRLGVPGADYVTSVGPQLGVHVVRLLRPGERPPAGCPVTVDVSEAWAMTVYAAGRPGGSSGFADGVSLAYVRDIADTLAD